MRVVNLGLVMIVIAAVRPAVAMAQPSYELLRSFVLPPAAPTHLVELESGVFAGATAFGGSSNAGAIVRLDRQSDGSFRTTVLHSFAAGHRPHSLLRGADGALYGTTGSDGTTFEDGTAFRLTLGGVFTTLHVFPSSDGIPELALRLANGDFYGTRTTGIFGVVPVFRMTPDGIVTDLAFSPPPQFPPLVRLAQTPNGDVFGFVNGSFVQIVSDEEVKVLRELPSNITEGSGLIASADGNLYATTRESASGPATVVRLTPAGVISVLRAFPAGSGANALMEASDGQLYGLSSEPSSGTWRFVVFQLTKTGGYRVLHRFSFWDGDGSTGYLIQSSSGSLIGTMAGGGTSRRGVVYEIGVNGFAVRSHFSDPTPLNPSGPLVRGADGALYGTSCEGGDYNAGTVFRLTEAGALTIVHSFRYWDGACPSSGVVRGNDGSFYGTATASLIGQGTIFKITPGGAFTLLHILAPGSGRAPVGLLLASDGNFYGTTSWFDGVVAGAVFRITPAGTFSLLHVFPIAGEPIRVPWAGLAQGADGALYGTTLYPLESPGAFRLTLTGAYEQWQPFGSLRLARRLIRAADGNLYGTTANEVIRMTPDGNVTLVSALTPGVAPYPIGDLLQGSDGALYGTTWAGGAANFGTVFRVTVDGAYETLHSFVQADGEKSRSTLAETTPGTFYGTTSAGGPGNGGVIFRLIAQPPPF